jgi:hypothetical protein
VVRVSVVSVPTPHTVSRSPPAFTAMLRTMFVHGVASPTTPVATEMAMTPARVTAYTTPPEATTVCVITDRIGPYAGKRVAL